MLATDFAPLDSLLQDPLVTDICINGDQSVFIDRQGLECVPIRWSEAALKNWTIDALSRSGKTWDAKHPFIDAVLETGHRLHVIFPPIAKPGILISIRRLGSRTGFSSVDPESMRALALARWQDSPHFLKLIEIVRQGDSLLLSGATGSGKTTLLNDLLMFVPGTERILAIEDTPELHPFHPHFVSLTSRPPNADGCGEVTLRTLLKQSLRMRPDRIILGECRGAEVLDLLQALNTGHQGALATLHANSPRDCLRRIELLCLLSAGSAIPTSTLRELLAGGIRWIAQIHRTPQGRRITEVQRVEGKEGDTLLLRPIPPLEGKYPVTPLGPEAREKTLHRL